MHNTRRTEKPRWQTEAEMKRGTDRRRVPKWSSLRIVRCSVLLVVFFCQLAATSYGCPSAGFNGKHPLHFYLPPVIPFIPPVYPPVTIRTNSCSLGSGTRIRWRTDGRCGTHFPLANRTPSECDPSSDRPCCSDYGYCGNSPSHCGCLDCIDFRNVIREPGCHFSLAGENGFLESPNFPNQYPPGRDCCYDIARPSPKHCGVRLTVENLDVGRGEEEGFCRRDWVSLPSCVPERGTRICGNSTGQVFQYLFQPGASAIRFVFHAGEVSEGRSGFRIKYQSLTTCTGPYQTQTPPISVIPGTSSAPCYTKITDIRGTVNTPYHPKKYPDNLDCVYEFIRSSQDVCGIRMQSVTFEMDPPLMTIFGGACTDFLHLPSCGFLCGKVNFSWVVSFQPDATSLKFHFHSDETTGHTGFLINFEQVTEC
ncbi:neuropilin-2-like isoform X1 [Homarus americanus]|uniref:neuropilin-2-like isoform X1 n=1 Tax=Homarus americanus TaxID=6706 RepID=UPI001C467A2A|nr:neuropilin-2-like isoform X1 [Homarus americanus]